MELEPLATLLEHVAKEGLEIITFHEKPRDRKRADMVQYPVEIIECPATYLS